MIVSLVSSRFSEVDFEKNFQVYENDQLLAIGE